MRRCQAVQLEKENYHYGGDLDEGDLDEDGLDDVFVCVERSLKFTHTAHMCGGLKQVWGDQKAGGPENL